MSEKHKHLLIFTEICKNLDLLAAIIHIGIPETKRNVQNEIPRPHFRYRPIPSLRVPSGTGDRGRHQQFQPRLGLMVIRDHTPKPQGTVGQPQRAQPQHWDAAQDGMKQLTGISISKPRTTELKH